MYFTLLFKEAANQGVAISDADEPFFLPREGSIEEWTPLSLRLERGGYSDYLANDIGCRLCSEKMRRVVEAGRAMADVVQWLPVRVRHNNEEVPYYILHFPSPPAVLDDKRTIRSGDFVVKPVLDARGIGAHAVTSYKGAGSLPLIVSASVRERLERDGCTGIEFSRMPMSVDGNDRPRS